MPLSELEQFGKNLKDFRERPQDAVTGILEAFTAITIAKLKQNLQNSGSVASGSLSQSIAPLPIEVDENGNLVLQIEMNDYWDFVNQGVNGTQQSWSSEYLFSRTAKTPTTSGTNFPDSIKQWMSFKGINTLSWMDKDGDFITKHLSTDEDFDNAAFAIMQGIKKKGIEPTFFVDDYLTEETINDLSEGLAEAVAQDLVK